jgi:hypothetical protein
MGCCLCLDDVFDALESIFRIGVDATRRRNRSFAGALPVRHKQQANKNEQRWSQPAQCPGYRLGDRRDLGDSEIGASQVRAQGKDQGKISSVTPTSFGIPMTLRVLRRFDDTAPPVHFRTPAVVGATSMNFLSRVAPETKLPPGRLVATASGAAAARPIRWRRRKWLDRYAYCPTFLLDTSFEVGNGNPKLAAFLTGDLNYTAGPLACQDEGVCSGLRVSSRAG